MGESIAAQPENESPSRGRAVAAALCLILAALLTVPAPFSYWGQRTINDGQRYVDTVGPLVDSPEVQAAIATKVTDAIESQVNVEALLNQVFADIIKSRPRLQALVGPLSGAVNGLIETQVRAFIASDAFAEFWVAANTRAQEALVRLLKGDDFGGRVRPGRRTRPRPLRRHRPGQAASGRPRAHDRPERPADSRGEPADRAAGGASAEAGAHDLRVREPGGQVAAGGRRAPVPGRAPAVPAQAEDDDHHRRSCSRRTPCSWRSCSRSAGSCSSTSYRGRCSVRRARSSSTSCSPTSSAVSTSCSGSG